MLAIIASATSGYVYRFETSNNFIKINYQDQQSSFFHQVESRFVTFSQLYRLGKNEVAS
nr:hypothetical protein [uncultured Chryseobacterium sp.]